MSEPNQYPAGVPCWVETLQPQPRAAVDFYGPLLGWKVSEPEPEPMPGGIPGDYFVARIDGRQVAGIGTVPDLGGPPMAVWNTYVGVDNVEQSVDRVEGCWRKRADGAAGRHSLRPLRRPRRRHRRPDQRVRSKRAPERRARQ